MEREYFLDLIPAYALGALDEEERAEFELMLADDAEAQALLAEYQTLADLLVLTVSVQTAPAHLGEDLLRRISEPPPQLAPLPAPRKRRLWLPAAAIIAVLFGISALVAQLNTPPQQSYYQRAKALYQQLASTDGIFQWTLAPADNYGEIDGQLLANPVDNTAVLMVNNLPVLSDDQAYQLWFVNGEGSVSSGGVYGKTREGPTYLILNLDEPLERYQRVGCSLEPAGGSPFPDKRSGPGVFRVDMPLPDGYGQSSTW